MDLTRPVRPDARDATRRRRRRGHGRAGLGAGLALAITVLAGCAADDAAANNPPGMNVRVNDISVRYAHLEDPDSPGTGYREGDDVPLYLWLVNESGAEAALTEVSSPIATGVTLTEGQTPVDLPVGTLVELGPDDPHFVLEGITTQIRGAEFVPVNLTFSDGTAVEIMVEAIEIGPID